MKKKILIVDDSDFMRSMIEDTLITAGFDVVGKAGNGEAAIDMALELTPDIITLDNILPDMLGMDVLKILKSEMNLKAKVIMISAVGQESSIQEGKKLGASDYLVKPFTPEDLMETINRVSSEIVV